MKLKIIGRFLASLVLSASVLFSGCGNSAAVKDTLQTVKTSLPGVGAETTKPKVQSFDLSHIPDFANKPFVVLHNNVPDFPDKDKTKISFEHYSPLDRLGRCGAAYANIGRDLMPTQKRGPIGSIKPSGWQTKKYDFIDGKYLYNRCHLIGYQLTAENANPRNLITGTRYLNVTGMLPFENMVADYIKETNGHVLYRVTPIFQGDELVARGVQMEGYSVEDKGEAISFNVYVYNNQPGIRIDYKTGLSKRG